MKKKKNRYLKGQTIKIRIDKKLADKINSSESLKQKFLIKKDTCLPENAEVSLKLTRETARHINCSRFPVLRSVSGIISLPKR